MEEEAHWFDSEGDRLFGILHRPEESRGLVLILHGFTGDHIGSNYYFVDLARKLSDSGFSVFRFDYAGSGNSEGVFREQGLDRTVRDAGNALEYLEDVGAVTRPLSLVGHSKGGSTAILLAGEREVDSMVMWSTVSSYRDLWTEEEIENVEEEDTLTLYGFRWDAERAFEEFEYDFPDRVSDLEIPTLFIHGEKDGSVPPEHSEELYESSSEPKDLLKLENSDHLFSDPGEREKLIERTVDWIGRTV
ncbi:MAG: alpha/beta fold hydrolase [Candidatus Nanohaloarchaea archaeon]|nr:alpha/beta fold hydrolase [Candidatus Nanohaloarchaea archaeon]